MKEILEAGTWEYDKNENSILMSSTVEKHINGKAKVIKVTEDELPIKFSHPYKDCDFFILNF